MLPNNIFASIKLVIFDFDGVFTDNCVYIDQNGSESVRCWRGDGLGLQYLRTIGIAAIIVSTESNPVVSIRAKKLGITCVQNVSDKAEAVLKICAEMMIDPSNVMFVGNDVNDLPALEKVGAPVCVSDADPSLYPLVLYRTKKPGGHGAVREICELILRYQAPHLKSSQFSNAR